MFEELRRRKNHAQILCCIALATLFAGLSGCGTAKSDPASEAPPPAQVEHESDLNLIQVDHPDQFPVVAAKPHMAASQLVATGAVSPDVSRNVPVPSLASGRVVQVAARLGDTVEKGQLLLVVRSDDVATGYSTYQKAVVDETLSNAQLSRAKDLFGHGAASLNDLQIAQDAEDKAKVDVATALQHLRLLGNDPNHPSEVVNIYAPVSGVITDQQVTNAGAVQALGSNPFTISDLSSVWILCDVHENDLPNVHMGDAADIRLNAYPNRLFKGRVSNIGAVLDPTLRTTKVRIEVQNPGIMRLGMFVTATFRGQTESMHAEIPASAILHLHDRDWVFVAAPNNKFQRVEVVGGITLPGNMQEVTSGIQPGTQVVGDALALENTADQ